MEGTKENGKMARGVEMELTFIIMEAGTKENGKMARGVEMELTFIMMETGTKENGNMIRGVEMAIFTARCFFGILKPPKFGKTVKR